MTTNQRIYFDISSCGRYVVSGGTDSKIRVWDLNSNPVNNGSDDPVIEPISVLADLHSDCINGVSLHPWKSVMATSSGQRHFDVALDIEEDENVENCLKDSKEFSLKLWNFDSLENDDAQAVQSE